MKQGSTIRSMTVSALCLALCMVLPLLTGQIPQIGNMLSPMHLPVMLCGFICGWPWALLIGLIAPPLRFLLFGMPPLFPSGLGMMAELAVYGAAVGLLYRALPKKPVFLYAALGIAMILGRFAWGLVRWTLMLFGSGAFTFQMFLAGALLNAWPGILLQLLVIPPVILALNRNKLME